ncbi:ParA family protein [Sulfurospirillum cavolei]|uniref:ParA family protein n=1 Tax=Sulfurospirillum cavolei TaxID=366522 RepID=UPI003FA233D6
MKIISFSHQKGGVGKSTLCFNVAAMLSSKSRTRIIDLDVQETATNLNFLREYNNLKPFDIQKANTNEQLLELFQCAEQEKLEYICVDCGGFDADVNRVAISLSDVIITPVSTKPFEIFGLNKFITILEEIEEDAHKPICTNVVMNNIHPSLKDIQVIQDLCASKPNKVKLAQSMIRSRASFVASSAVGASVFEKNFDLGQARKEIISICEELILYNL